MGDADNLPRHEWYLEFQNESPSIAELTGFLEQQLRSRNSYYDDLIAGKVLDSLLIKMVRTEGFKSYMKSVGKLGGQNKVARLANDRKIADGLQQFVVR